MNNYKNVEQELKNMFFTLIIHVPAYKPPNDQSDNHVLKFVFELVMSVHTGAKGYLPRLNPVKSSLILGFVSKFGFLPSF